MYLEVLVLVEVLEVGVGAQEDAVAVFTRLGRCGELQLNLHKVSDDAG